MLDTGTVRAPVAELINKHSAYRCKSLTPLTVEHRSRHVHLESSRHFSGSRTLLGYCRPLKGCFAVKTPMSCLGIAYVMATFPMCIITGHLDPQVCHLLSFSQFYQANIGNYWLTKNLDTYMHTHIHTYIHIYIYTYIPVHSYTVDLTLTVVFVYFICSYNTHTLTHKHTHTHTLHPISGRKVCMVQC